MRKNIVFITDCDDIGYNELRATVLNELDKLDPNGSSIRIEPVVSVKPFSLVNGSFLLRLLAESYPEGTIFSIILNPSKDRPERLIGRTSSKNFSFLGANTGVFEWFLRDFGLKELFELNDPGFVPFGGKFIHAPAAARIANGTPLNKLGSPFDVNKLKKLSIVKGMILHVDNFGLMKFYTTLPPLTEGDLITVKIGNRILRAVYAKRMMSRETGEWVIYPGSSLGFPELGKVRENGALLLGVKEGDTITLEFNNPSPR